ncbi:MAG: ion transporter [Hydrocarboniphaga sp.]|uniref:ion transporter n=1 Tax=Hydrocarboniphaga sp. TaxID=2033016 RepID=UPI0026303CA4|nr:ion transporter [Hydrocarboniphaga sp.]MDB5969719.1 ion transporter [Hydrocarboniphaga sp.]
MTPPQKTCRALDWAMLALAIASISLLLWDSLSTLSAAQQQAIRAADLGICAAFAAEFLYRWHRHRWSAGYVARNWYDVLGMIPVQQPALRAFRLVRILILISRVGMTADRVYGDEFFHRLSWRLKRALVKSISGAVTLAVIDEVETVLYRGTYTRNLSRALDRNRDELRTLILDKMRQDPRTGKLSKIPFYDDIVESVVNAALRVSGDLLEDPRSDLFVADLLRENLEQIRSAVEQREQQHEKSTPPAPG